MYRSHPYFDTGIGLFKLYRFFYVCHKRLSKEGNNAHRRSNIRAPTFPQIRNIVFLSFALMATVLLHNDTKFWIFDCAGSCSWMLGSIYRGMLALTPKHLAAVGYKDHPHENYLHNKPFASYSL